MHLIWRTAEAEGEYWAFIHVEGLCNFRLVHVDDWPFILLPLSEHFNIELWLLYENLPRLLTIDVVWEVIISELLWKGLKTRMCINIFSILEMGQRNKKGTIAFLPLVGSYPRVLPLLFELAQFCPYFSRRGPSNALWPFDQNFENS